LERHRRSPVPSLPQTARYASLLRADDALLTRGRADEGQRTRHGGVRRLLHCVLEGAGGAVRTRARRVRGAASRRRVRRSEAEVEVSWTPLREPKMYVAWQWRALIDDAGLRYDYCRKDDGVGGEWEYATIEGQDGWAYECASQLYTAASVLVTDH